MKLLAEKMVRYLDNHLDVVLENYLDISKGWKKVEKMGYL